MPEGLDANLQDPNTQNPGSGGGTQSNQVSSTSENDTIDGGTGDDCVFGREGDDLLFGGEGNDRLDGDLEGQTGSDEPTQAPATTWPSAVPATIRCAAAGAGHAWRDGRSLGPGIHHSPQYSMPSASSKRRMTAACTASPVLRNWCSTCPVAPCGAGGRKPSAWCIVWD